MGCWVRSVCGGACWLPAQTAHPLAPKQPCLQRIMSDRVIYGVQAPGPMVFGWWEEEARERLQHQHLQRLSVRRELCFLPLPSMDQRRIKKYP